MREKLENVFWFLLEIIPPLLTIGFAMYAVLESRRGGLQQMQVLTWILALLGLLATSELVERFRRLKRIEDFSRQTLTAVQALGATEVRIEHFLRDRRAAYPLEKRVGKASEISVCGYSLVHLIRQNESFLRELLRQGCQLKVLLIKPESEAASMIDAALTPAREGQLSHDLTTTFGYLQDMRAWAEATARGKLEIRLLKVIPSFSLIVVDGDTPKGWIHVEIYPAWYKSPVDVDRPHFVVTAGEGRWYKFFYDQFVNLWYDPQYSEPYVLPDVETAVAEIESISLPYDFIDHFAEAEKSGYSGSVIRVHPNAKCGEESKRGIFEHPPDDPNQFSTLTYNITLPPGTRPLKLGGFVGIQTEISEAGGPRTSKRDPENGVQFDILINGKQELQQQKYSSQWEEFSIRIPPSESLSISFRTNCLGNAQYNWAVWGQPVLIEVAE